MKTKTELLIVIISLGLVVLIGCLIYFFAFPHPTATNTASPTPIAIEQNLDFGSTEYAYIKALEYLNLQPELSNQAYELVIYPSRLRCAGCYVAKITFTQNNEIQFFDVSGDQISPSDGTNLVDLSTK